MQDIDFYKLTEDMKAAGLTTEEAGVAVDLVLDARDNLQRLKRLGRRHHNASVMEEVRVISDHTGLSVEAIIDALEDMLRRGHSVTRFVICEDGDADGDIQKV